MENKINIAELLKDCPKGMKLYSPLCGTCVFDRLNMGTIICKKQNTEQITFTSEGYYMLPIFEDCECMIFPSKNQRDWGKFHRPFKDGDIITCTNAVCTFVAIFKEKEEHDLFLNYAVLTLDENSFFRSTISHSDFIKPRLATEEEKRKLFDAIKDNGYKWNPETKTLEELIIPKFHEGDWLCANKSNDYAHLVKIIKVVDVFGKERYKVSRDYDSDLDVVECDLIEKNYHLWTIQDAKDGDVLYSPSHHLIWIYKDDKHYYACVNMNHVTKNVSIDGLISIPNDVCPATKGKQIVLFAKMKEEGYEWIAETKTLNKLPKFKVGDKIAKKNGICVPLLITKVSDKFYYSNEVNSVKILSISDQDEYELIPNKFDINTLVPFESRVLVRAMTSDSWKPATFGCVVTNSSCPYVTLGGVSWNYCIPYEGNEYLFNTTNDCDNFYKTWE